LKEPTTTAELMDLVEYIDQARGQLLLNLKEDISEGIKMFFAIMDYSFIDADDREMTALAHTWHRKIQPAFEKSSIVSLKNTGLLAVISYG
jgi:dynein heavy chain